MKLVAMSAGDVGVGSVFARFHPLRDNQFSAGSGGRVGVLSGYAPVPPPPPPYPYPHFYNRHPRPLPLSVSSLPLPPPPQQTHTSATPLSVSLCPCLSVSVRLNLFVTGNRRKNAISCNGFELRDALAERTLTAIKV